MQDLAKGRFFNPHGSARMESLAGAPLATFKQRLAAFAIDIFLVFGTYFPAMIGLQYLIEERLHLQEDLYRSAHVQVRFDFHGLVEVAWTVWLVLYFGLFVWGTNGQTPGKRLLRIRVVSLTQAKITLWQAIERALGYGASALEAGFGFFQYFLQPNRCCVHDRIAETIVVNERVGSPAKAATR
jgi:uncharacterized RDD family membrane protein YckC